MKRVLIGIQSRSTSQRFPGKCFQLIGTKRLLDHVIDSCQKAAKYSNQFSYKKEYAIEVALLIPTDDVIKKAFSSCKIIEGPEYDVLTRYKIAQKELNADYICRITGDCPLIPPYIISKHITLAIAAGYDYVSNVDEQCRLSLDGLDCEVLSKEMLDWLDKNGKTPADREHVTLLARKQPPHWAKLGFTAGFFDQSGIKLSVDTPEDLQNVRAEYDKVGRKLRLATAKYGQNHHRF